MNDKGQNSIARAKLALWRRVSVPLDRNGYVDLPEKNLVAGVRLEQFQAEVEKGNGNELHGKFRAVHSSAALAVNCFAPFKDVPLRADLRLMDIHGADLIQFEKKNDIVPGRRPSNLDVWIVKGNRGLALESKLLEYFKQKAPEFAPAYDDLAPPTSDPYWWRAFELAKTGGPQHLDTAQLIKHYFGLCKLKQRTQAERLQEPADLCLLYLFWEPINGSDIPECAMHRLELTDFAKTVSGSSIPFRWMTYAQLWAEWLQIPALAQHARNLKARYEVVI